MSNRMQATTWSKALFLLTGILALLVSLSYPNTATADAIIADHTTTDITAIPQAAIEAAKAALHIGYGHTSHGSQITSGMSGLVGFANNGGKGLSLPHDIFAWNNGGTGGALDLEEGAGYESGWLDHDVGYYPSWIDETRAYLDDPSHADVNVIMWSWCGQASGRSEQSMIDTYLAPMTQLELDYPHVTFVYMTGHADGGGETGNLHLRNQQIRDYCMANDKVLFDFYDIETYDPDGNYFGDRGVDDACNYDGGNWATEWQNSHTRGVDWYSCGSAHSQPLNANQKAYAIWWLWARLAGWGECAPAPGNTIAIADSDLEQITVQWTDNSINEDSFTIQRQVDGGTWDNAYATVAANTTTYTDEALLPGIYRYQVVAHRDDDGSGSPCDSGVSPAAQAEIVDADLPAAPSDLTAVADSITGAITLAWTDQADNEAGFIVQRQVVGGAWDLAYATVAADQTGYMDTGLIAGTYTYRIVATNSHGDSAPSNAASAAIVQSVPTDPTNLTATVNGFDIDLSWRDNSDNENAFVIEQRIDSGAFAVLVNDLAPNTDTYTDAGLAPMHTYTYRVKAVNSFGDSAWTNEADQTIYNQVVTITLNDDGTGEVVDAFLRSGEPDSNFGSTNYTSNYDRFIMQFNLPAEVMNKTIVTAEMSVYVWNVDAADAGTPLPLYPLTRAWDEGAVTWNEADAGIAWTTAGGDLGTEVGQLFVENLDHQFLTPVNITDLVQQWVDGSTPNYGLVLDKGTDVGMAIKASEYGQHASPYLTITYTNKVCTDLDGDGDVDGADLAELAGAFDPGCASSFAAAFGR